MRKHLTFNWKHSFGILLLLFMLCSGIEAAVEQALETQPTISFSEVILGNPIIALFLVVGVGMLVGQIRLFGLSLGSSGVIFSAIALGALGYTIPKSAGTIGLIIFVYCIGINAGPGFFRAFAQQGSHLAKLGVLLVIIGAACTVAFAKAFDIPIPLAVGVFAGAMTSTPALAAALDSLPDSSSVSIGYGIAYPFGVVGVVLLVQLLPRMLKRDLEAEAKKYASMQGGDASIQRVLIEVNNPGIIGKKIAELPFIPNSRCQISRVMWEDRLVPITPETKLDENMKVLVVGESDHIEDVIRFLGHAIEDTYLLDIETQRMKIVLTKTDLCGKSLRKLNLLNQFGVTISRIIRNDISFVPTANTVLKRYDILMSIGEANNLKRFAEHAGHRTRVVEETDLISLTFGLVAGIILGMVPIGLPGTGTIALGMAGGPLLVGLMLGHFGKIGFVRGYIPRPARLFLTEIGLVFFLAGAGVKAGGQFFTVLREYGVVLLLMGFVVTSVPMIVGYLFSRKVLKLNFLQSLGGICGSMTSTPGLGAITSKTDSDIPVISYAAAYPVALILMTIFAQAIVAAFN